VPELRSAMTDQFAVQLGETASMIGQRLGLRARILEARTLAGAIIGVAMSVSLDGWCGTPGPADLTGLAVSSTPRSGPC